MISGCQQVEVLIVLPGDASVKKLLEVTDIGPKQIILANVV